MPNRILKESIWTSENLNRCSLPAQGFFYRLLPLPDDHGCFDARPAIIRGRLYPLMPKVTEKQIEGWIMELLSVDVIRLWLSANGNRYGIMTKWGEHQRVRSIHKRKTPEPPENLLDENSEAKQEDTEPADTCRQLTADDGLNHNHNPNHNLNPEETNAVYVDSFKDFWSSYPERNGKRLEKGKTQELYGKVKEEELPLLLTAVKNYADSEMIVKGIGIKDPKRFFLNDFWRDWIEPEKKVKKGSSHENLGDKDYGNKVGLGPNGEII